MEEDEVEFRRVYELNEELVDLYKLTKGLVIARRCGGVFKSLQTAVQVDSYSYAVDVTP